MEKKLISILTTTRNVENTVRETFESIHSQTFTNFEHLVKDAESTDHTIEIIKSYGDKIAYFESSPDKGIYDGLNLLATRAKGEWSIVIHAGDLLYSPDTLEMIVPHLSEDTDIVYGTVINIHETGVVQKKTPYPVTDIWKGMIGSHQAMFIRTELLKKYPYNLSWRVAADYDFLWKCIRAGAHFKKIDTIVATVSGTGLSSKRILSNFKEKAQVAATYDSKMSHAIVWKMKVFGLLVRQKVKAVLPANIVKHFITWKNSK